MLEVLLSDVHIYRVPFYLLSPSVGRSHKIKIKKLLPKTSLVGVISPYEADSYWRTPSPKLLYCEKPAMSMGPNIVHRVAHVSYPVLNGRD